MTRTTWFEIVSGLALPVALMLSFGVAHAEETSVATARRALAAAATPQERTQTADALGHALLSQSDPKSWSEAADVFKGELATSGGTQGQEGLLAALFALHRDPEVADLLQSLRKQGKSEDDIQTILFLSTSPRDKQQADEADERLHQLDPNAPFRVGGKVSRPEILHTVRPELTKEARSRGVAKTVVLLSVIDTQGRVTTAKELAAGPMGVARVLEGRPTGLSENAVNAVQQWTFKPAMRDGKPVPVWYVLTVNFKVGG